MLRAIIDLVPYGIEDEVRRICTVEVANIGPPGMIADYACQMKKDGIVVSVAYVRNHNRRDGAEILIAKAIEELKKWR